MNRPNFEIVSARVVPVGQVEPQLDSWDTHEAQRAQNLAAGRRASRRTGQVVLRQSEGISNNASDGELHPSSYGAEHSRATTSVHE